MSLAKLPAVRTPLSAEGVWIVPVSKVLWLGCLMSACPNPDCPCTELMVSAYPLDERVHAFGFKKGKLVSENLPLDDQPLRSSKPMALRLDVYTGEWSSGDARPMDVQDRRVAALADALDAETLDELEALWRRQKGIASREGHRKAQMDPRESGELLYWDSVFEIDRPEMFLDSGRRVVALDMYCVDPDCDLRRHSESDPLPVNEQSHSMRRVTTLGRQDRDPPPP